MRTLIISLIILTLLGCADKAKKPFEEAEQLYTLGQYKEANVLYTKIRQDYPNSELIPIIQGRINNCNRKIDFMTYHENIAPVLDKLSSIKSGLSVGYSYMYLTDKVREACVSFEQLQQTHNNFSYKSFELIQEAINSYKRSFENDDRRMYLITHEKEMDNHTKEILDKIMQMAWKEGISCTTKAQEFLKSEKQMVMKIEIAPQVKIIADAEKNPLVCAILLAKAILANTIEDVQSKSDKLARIAEYCLEAGQQDKASEVLNQALQTAKEIEDFDSKAGKLERIATHYLKAGQQDRASEVLNQAFQTAKEIEDAQSKTIILKEIAYTYIEAGQQDKASEVLNQAFQTAKQEVTSLAPPGDAKSYLQGTIYWEHFDIPVPNIFSQYAKIGCKDKASEVLAYRLQLVEERLQFVKETKNGGVESTFYKMIFGDMIAYIARDYARLGEYNRAFQITEKIEDVDAKIRALCDIAVEYAEAGQKDKAIEILSQPLKLAEKIKKDDDSRNTMLQNIAEAFCDIAVKYAEAGEYNQALQITAQIDDDYYKTKALYDIAVECAKAGLKDKASEILSQALQIEKTMENAYRREDIAIKCAEVGEYNKALQIVERIKDANSKAEALCEIAIKYTEAGQKDKAIEILSQALQIAEKLEKDYSAWRKEDIVIGFAKAREYTKAIQVANKLEDVADKVSALCEIAINYSEHGQNSKASEILSQAILVTQTMEKVDDKVWALCKIGVKYAKTGLKLDNRDRKSLHEIMCKEGI